MQRDVAADARQQQHQQQTADLFREHHVQS